MIDLPQFTLFDIIFGFGLFCVFCLVLLAGFLASGAIKWIIFSLCAILFFAMPFVNIFMLERFVYRTNFIDSGSKKLVYIDSFLLRGIVQNEGKITLKNCDFYLYTKNTYPLKPNYIIEFSDLHLRVGDKIEIEKSIDNFSDDEIKTIALRCY